MQSKAALALLATTALLIAGCSSGPSIEGKWSASIPNAPVPATIEFKAGKMTQTIDIKSPVEVKIDVTGTYSFDGKSITITPSNVAIDDSKLPAAMKSQVLAMMSSQKAEMMKPQTATVTFKDETATLLDAKGESVVLTKIK